MLNTILFVLQIIYLIVRIPLVLLMGLSYMIDSCFHEGIGYTYMLLSALTGFLICITTIYSFSKTNKYGWTLSIALLTCDFVLFVLLSQSFPRPYCDNIIYNATALLSLILIVVTASRQLFHHQTDLKGRNSRIASTEKTNKGI